MHDGYLWTIFIFTNDDASTAYISLTVQARYTTKYYNYRKMKHYISHQNRIRCGEGLHVMFE
jgi:hypothetical protein